MLFVHNFLLYFSIWFSLFWLGCAYGCFVCVNFIWLFKNECECMCSSTLETTQQWCFDCCLLIGIFFLSLWDTSDFFLSRLNSSQSFLVILFIHYFVIFYALLLFICYPDHSFWGFFLHLLHRSFLYWLCWVCAQQLLL